MQTDASASVQRMNARAAALRATMPDETISPGGGSAKNLLKGGGGGSASGARRRGGGGDITTDAARLAADYEVVRHRYEDALKENETLKGEQKRRMESYMRRETNYQAEIEDLKAELERQGKARPPEDERMHGLRHEHSKVMDRLNAIKQREQLSLQDQEKDLLRAFRARLWDVQFELEAERSKKDDGALEWIEKTKTLGKELDWSRDEALRLDRMNQHLTKENQRLKTQLKSQEDDREFIVRQMLALKKENSRLKASTPSDADGASTPLPPSPPHQRGGAALGGGRAQSADQRRGGGAATDASGRPRTASAAAFRALEEIEASSTAKGGASLAASERIKELMLQQAESEERYREVVARLKRLLDVERRNLRAVRAAHAKDLQSRTELETLLRACVDDVRKEIAAQRAGGGGGAGGGSPAKDKVGVDDLAHSERERVLELLLSQERVVALLYERTFPPRTEEQAAAAAAIMEGADDEATEEDAEAIANM